MTPPPSAIVLEGTAEGHRLRFVLASGAWSLGSGEDCDLLVPVPGVSRRHAVVTARSGRLVVEDARSKNGTFVNGTRVLSAEVRIGDRVHLGPVALTVGTADPNDARLALPAAAIEQPGGAGSRRTEETESRHAEGGAEAPRWTSLLNRAAGLLVGRSTPALAVMVRDVVESVGCRGACLVSWQQGQKPLLVAAAGELPSASELDGALAAARHAGRSVADEDAALEGVPSEAGPRGSEPAAGGLRIRLTSTVLEDGPAAACAACGSELHALVLTGSYHWRTASRSLLEALLRLALPHLASSAAPGSTAPAPPASSMPSLVYPAGHVIGHSQPMKRLYQQLSQVLPGTLPVLVVGPTGSGKEHIARILHASSGRRDGPFVAVNCAAIPSELLEAELFGIERGVATGVTARTGTLEQASGGVVLLDEIGDMSPALQAKMLRALQQNEVHPVGALKPRPVDVRIVSATNADLAQRLADGSFRADLYYRLAGLTLRLPRMTERREDIPGLVEHFMNRTAAEIAKPIRGITVKAMRALTDAPWPGNVRQLENEVRRLVSLCPPGQAIDSSLLDLEALEPTAATESVQAFPLDLDLTTAIEALERRLITGALKRTGGNRTRAAALLGTTRNGLAIKMKRLGVEM